MRVESEFAVSKEVKPFAKIKVPKKLIPSMEREQVWTYAPLLRPAVTFIEKHLSEESVIRKALNNPTNFAFRGFRREKGKHLTRALLAVEKNGIERSTEYQGPWIIPTDAATALYYAIPDRGEVGIVLVFRVSGMSFKGNPITYTADLKEGQSLRDLHVGTIQLELVN